MVAVRRDSFLDIPFPVFGTACAILVLLLPLATQALDMNQFQYGLFLMYALLLGILTPPLAPVLTIMAPIAKISMERLSIAILPFFGVMVFVLFLIAFVPAMTTWLPRLAGYQ